MTDNNSPMTVGSWLVTLIVLAIPLVGLIMALVWAFSSNTNVNRSNYAKAVLILMAILVALAILMAVLGVSMAPSQY